MSSRRANANRTKNKMVGIPIHPNSVVMMDANNPKNRKERRAVAAIQRKQEKRLLRKERDRNASR